MNENLKELLKLVQENPDLPVVCWTDSDIVAGDDYGRWLSSVGAVWIGEIACYNDRFYDDRDQFEEDYYDQNDDILDERFGYDSRKSLLMSTQLFSVEEVEANKEAEKRLNAYLHEISAKAFHPAIIVNIDLPDFDFPEVENVPRKDDEK